MSNAVISIIKLFLIAVSFSGYGLFIFNKYKIKSELLPVTIFSAVGVVVYIAAILNLLPATAILIYIGGFSLFAYTIIKYKTACFKNIISFGLVFFVVMCGFFIVFLRSAKLYGYDDFTHWGMIVKELNLFDRLPNFSSKTIAFPTYPPMTALFTYYVTKFIGFGENKALMSHVFFILAFASSIFVFTPKGKKGLLANLTASLSVLLMLSLYPHGITTLMVDTVLPLAALANTAIIIYYKDDLKKASILSFLIMTCTILIKNSGLFFAIINMGLLIFFMIKDIKKNKQAVYKKILTVTLSIVMSLFMFVIWKSHINLVFPTQATLGHHAMNIENYQKNFTDKPQEQIKEIQGKFIENSLNFKSKPSKVMIIFSVSILIIVIAARVIFKKKLKATFKALVWMLIFYVLYLFGVYAMYLFSMPPAEASSFDSFNRYVVSAVIFIVGIFTIGFLYDVKELPLCICNYIIHTIIIGAFTLSIILSKGYTILYQRSQYEKDRIWEYESGLANTPINYNDSYLLYCPSNQWDNGFRYYLTKYKLFTTDFEFVNKPDENLLDKISQYDHFVIIQKNEEMEKYSKYQK